MVHSEAANVPVITSDLEDLVNAVRELFDAGNYSGALSLIESNIVEVWYGFQPEQLRAMLDTIASSGEKMSMLIAGLYQFLTGGPTLYTPTQAVKYVRENPSQPFSLAFRLTQTLELRLRGRADAALALLDKVGLQMGSSQTLFDARDGWDLFVSLQAGITAMLGGAPQRALTYLTAAQMHPPVSTLVFLTRDAYVKMALVHAAHGSIPEARRLLAHAATLSRSSSWAEGLIDANALMAQALVESDPEHAIELFLAIPLQDIGEFWPYYAITLHRVSSRAGRWKELSARMRVLEKLPFPKENGKGFTGSVLPVIRASVAVARNDPESANWFLEQADSEHLGTQLMSAALDLHVGRYQSAVNTAWRLGDAVKGLRQSELQRYAILASGYLGLGRDQRADEILHAVVDLCGSIRKEDLRYFDLATRAFAAERVADWPDCASQTASNSPAQAPTPTLSLTNREREILRMLADGNTRAEMAELLFVTVNTVKTHLKAIYKKLEVSSRDAAVIRAEREGWL